MYASLAADQPACLGAGARVLFRLFRALAGGLVLSLVAVHPIAHAQGQPAEKRIALVIGNARYPKVPLGNPENDARLIARNLRKLGFEVDEQLNVDVRQFRRALRDFARRVQEDDAISVLYYAGHGVQIDGRNYLLPVDINLRDEEEVKDESVDIDELFLSRIEKARSHPRIVILDACRNNPFAGKTRNIRSAGGLAEMGARGTLIAFASAPGAPAEDGPDGTNSIYTRHLAEEMMVPGIEVERMFKNVRVKVLRDTDERQLPWVNTSLTTNFSFNPATGRTGASGTSASAVGAPTASAPFASAPSASGPATAAARPAARKFEPNELEQQLERAQRELDEARAAASEQAAQSLPSSSPRPAPQQPLPPAPQQPPPPAPVAALQSRPYAEPVIVPAPSGETRRRLDRAEVQQLLVGKTHTILDAAAAGYVMRWDLRSSGLIYYNSRSPGSFGGNGSGRWELKDDGSLCARFNPVPPGRLTDLRRPEDGCWVFFREGEKLMRASAQSSSAQPPVEIVKIQ